MTDENKLTFANGIVTRLRQDEEVMAQVNSHTPDQVMHGVFPKRVVDAVLDAMTDHEKLSLEVLDSEVKSKAFAVLILKMLSRDVIERLI